MESTLEREHRESGGTGGSVVHGRLELLSRELGSSTTTVGVGEEGSLHGTLQTKTGVSGRSAEVRIGRRLTSLADEPHCMVVSWSRPEGLTLRRPVSIISAQSVPGNEPRAGRAMAAVAKASCGAIRLVNDSARYRRVLHTVFASAISCGLLYPTAIEAVVRAGISSLKPYNARRSSSEAYRSERTHQGAHFHQRRPCSCPWTPGNLSRARAPEGPETCRYAQMRRC